MPLNTLSKDASPDQVLAELQENGAVIVQDLLGTQAVDTLTPKSYRLSIERRWDEMILRVGQQSAPARWRRVLPHAEI